MGAAEGSLPAGKRRDPPLPSRAAAAGWSAVTSPIPALGCSYRHPFVRQRRGTPSPEPGSRTGQTPPCHAPPSPGGCGPGRGCKASGSACAVPRCPGTPGTAGSGRGCDTAAPPKSPQPGRGAARRQPAGGALRAGHRCGGKGGPGTPGLGPGPGTARTEGHRGSDQGLASLGPGPGTGGSDRGLAPLCARGCSPRCGVNLEGLCVQSPPIPAPRCWWSLFVGCV